MSFSDWRRDGDEGRRVEGKYIPRGANGEEILRLDAWGKGRLHLDVSTYISVNIHQVIQLLSEWVEFTSQSTAGSLGYHVVVVVE